MPVPEMAKLIICHDMAIVCAAMQLTASAVRGPTWPLITLTLVLTCAYAAQGPGGGYPQVVHRLRGNEFPDRRPNDGPAISTPRVGRLPRTLQLYLPTFSPAGSTGKTDSPGNW